MILRPGDAELAPLGAADADELSPDPTLPYQELEGGVKSFRKPRSSKLGHKKTKLSGIRCTYV